MKKILRYPYTLAVVAIIAAVSFCSGCAAVRAVSQHAFLTPSVTDQATNTLTGEVSPAVTNYAPNAALVATLETGRKLSPLAPAPFGWILDAVGSFALGALGIYAQRKNKQLNTSQAIVSAVITGVEAIGHAETKKSIANSARSSGVFFPLAEMVEAQTK